MNKQFIISVVVFLIAIDFMSAGPKDEKIISAAREIVESVKYCTLISMGEDGYPNARTMDAFKPDKNWVIWMGTHVETRKVEEIRKNSKISVFYESPGGDGYVLLKGEGHMVNDPESKRQYFKKGWEEFYPGDRKHFILIRFVPAKLDVVSYKRGLLGEEKTWAAPSVRF